MLFHMVRFFFLSMVAQKTSKLRHSDWLLRNFNQSESGYLSYHGEQNGGHHAKEHWKMSWKLVPKISLHFVGSHHSEKQTVGGTACLLKVCFLTDFSRFCASPWSRQSSFLEFAWPWVGCSNPSLGWCTVPRHTTRCRTEFLRGERHFLASHMDHKSVENSWLFEQMNKHLIEGKTLARLFLVNNW